jgi:hypothetical protein
MTPEKLAAIWITYNGQKVTDKRIALTLRIPTETLIRMLKERNLIN